MNLNVGKLAAKATGIAGLGLIAYDSHNYGKLNATAVQTSTKASSLENSYFNTMTQDTPSSVVSKFKKLLFNMNADENISDFFTGIEGYFSGAGSMLVQNVVPFGLALGTFFKKGFVAKGSALGLLAYGIIYGIQNSGLTNTNKINF